MPGRELIFNRHIKYDYNKNEGPFDIKFKIILTNLMKRMT